MFSDTAETLKSQFTDRYVKVDANRPELARFRDVVGQVKTVNMNGRALVEFLDYHLNIGWYDIDLNSLTVVEAPSKDEMAKVEPKRAQDKTEGKAAPTAGARQAADAKAAPAGGEKKLSPLEMARMQGAGGKTAAVAAKPTGDKPAPAKKSTADILAAARGSAATSPAASTAKVEPKPAAATVAPAAKPVSGKMSTADILAAARGTASVPAAAAAPAPAAPQKPPAVEAAPQAPAASTPADATSGEVNRVDKSSMSVDEMIAYCRVHDAK